MVAITQLIHDTMLLLVLVGAELTSCRANHQFEDADNFHQEEVSLLQLTFQVGGMDGSPPPPPNPPPESNTTHECLDLAVVTTDRFKKVQSRIDTAFTAAASRRSSGSFLIDSICFDGACDDGSFKTDFSLVAPDPAHARAILRLARRYSLLNVTKKDLDSYYITFTRFGSGLDKLSCDWCSIVNGINELLMRKLRHADTAPDVLASFPSVIQQVISQLSALDVNRNLTFKASSAQLAEFKVPASVVEPLLEWRNAVEFIETRWCPFRHLRQISFNRSYYAFTPVEKDELVQAQSILQEKKRITGKDVTCDSCNRVVNEQLVKFRPDEVSLFDEAPLGVSYMDRLKCAFGIECLLVPAVATCNVSVLRQELLS